MSTSSLIQQMGALQGGQSNIYGNRGPQQQYARLLACRLTCDHIDDPDVPTPGNAVEALVCPPQIQKAIEIG